MATLAHASPEPLVASPDAAAPAAPGELSLGALLRADLRWHGGLKRAGGYASFWVVLSYRLSHALSGTPFDLLGKLVQFTARCVFHSNISRKAQIGPELVVNHPCAVFIGPHCRIGRRFTCGAGVFIGSNTDDRDPADYPVIGDLVLTAPGVRIMGGVTIGDGVTIGPNAVVIRDIPSQSLVLPPTSHVIQREAWNNFKASSAARKGPAGPSN